MRIAEGKCQRWMRDVAFTWNSGECLRWPFGKAGNGYPALWKEGAGARGGYKSAHVRVCEHFHGPKPAPHYEVLHACNVRDCVNYRHLRWGTKQENQSDRRRHGTISVNRGEAHGRAKLDNEKVLAIRASFDPSDDLAALYNVSRATINLVRGRRIWVHI